MPPLPSSCSRPVHPSQPFITPSDPCPPPPNPQSPSQPIGKMISSLCVSEIKALHFFTLPLGFQPTLNAFTYQRVWTPQPPPAAAALNCGRRTPATERERVPSRPGGRILPLFLCLLLLLPPYSSSASYYFSSSFTSSSSASLSATLLFLFCVYYPASFLYLFFLLLIFSSSSLTPSYRQDLHDNFFTTNCR